MIRIVVYGAAALALAALLSACSSGGVDSGGGGSSSTTTIYLPASDDDSWATRSVVFDPVLADAFLSSDEFKAADANCKFYGCASSGASGGNKQSQAFELHNVHFAHSAGLTGTGQLVAVVDNGFRITHREFTGKTIHQTGTLPIRDHGTHVASLIAANKDGLGMHGVAPDADLHLTAINQSGDPYLDIPNVTAGTLAAATLGAVAQNNSWGFEVSASTLRNHLNSNPDHSVAEGLTATLGYSKSDWQSYLNALDSFQQGGVIVWALSNDENMSSGDAMAALPYFDTRLREAWIAVANGYFQVDGNGNITDAVRLSAACGLAASFCIAGDGTTTAASADTDISYDSGTGTSYVAPQVAATIALLAEAFSDLTPAEWTKRVLASANNSWFATEGVAFNGTVDFGNGVTHSYSDEWGHGVLDLKAALSPIGSVAILSGESVTESTRIALSDSAISTPSTFGDGLASALRGQEMAVFDALNRSFAVDAGNFVQPQAATLVPELLEEVRLPRDAAGRAQLAALGRGPALESGTMVHMTGGLDRLMNGSGAIGGGSVLSLAGEAVAVTSSHALGEMMMTAYGFAGEHGAASGAVSGGGLSLAVPAGAGSITFGFGQLAEQGGVLGLVSSEAFDLGSGSALTTVNLGVEQQVTAGLKAFGRFEYGAASPAGATSGSLVASASDIRFAGVQLGAVATGMVTDNDSLTFSVAQPMRIESGTVQMAMPIGRTADGTVVQREMEAGLAPSGRELDLGLSYAVTLPNEAGLKLGIEYALDAGHVRGASAFAVAASFGQSF